MPVRGNLCRLTLHTKVQFWDCWSSSDSKPCPCFGKPFEDFAERVVQEARQLADAPPESVPAESGPTLRTQIRGEVFKKLKDQHPEWSQAKVAMEAYEELGEEVTADTVRNTYRALGWKWERADRIR